MGRIALVALLLLAALPQEPDWLAVGEWWGSFDIVVRGERSSPTGHQLNTRVGTFPFHLNHLGGAILKPGEDVSRLKTTRMWNWLPKKGEEHPVMTVSMEDRVATRGRLIIEGKGYEHLSSSRAGSGRGSIPVTLLGVPLLSIDAKSRRYGFNLDHFHSVVLRASETKLKSTGYSMKVYDSNTPTEYQRTESDANVALLDAAWPKVVIEDQPLPEKLEPLSGSVQLRGDLWEKGDGAALITVSWSMSPKPPPDVELILEPTDAGEYKEWRPWAGNSETDPGNSVGVRARLQKKGGGAPEVKASSITLELCDVTRIPGVCINYPPPPAAGDFRIPEPDLKFDLRAYGDPGGGWTIYPLQARRSGKDLTEASIGVVAYDFGAFGLFRARARLEDGRLLRGHLAGEPSRDALRIPKSAENSWIADSWKERVGNPTGADDSDDDNEPKGDGNKGDGLTLYEEYRGWYTAGHRWADEFDGGGDPRRKELFVCNDTEMVLDEPLEQFERITGLRVVTGLLKSEMSDQQVINFNHFSGPHRVDQHAVKVVLNAALPADVNGVTLPITGEGNPPGPPREKHLVQLRQGPAMMAGQNPDAIHRARTLMHELCHCCNVYHHTNDYSDKVKVTWTARKDLKSSDEEYDITETSKDGSRAIRILDEGDGTDLTSGMGYYINGAHHGTDQVLLGAWQGVGSGDERCVMTYPHWGEYFRSRKDPNVRYFIRKEEIANAFALSEYRLCTSPSAPEWRAAGNHPFEWNAPGHDPEPHYGPAKLGSCASQLLVNDAVTPVPRR